MPKKAEIKKTDVLPRCHWNRQHGRKRKAKKQFDTLHDANQYIENKHLETTYRSYKCPVCGKFHIGHRNNNNNYK